MKIKTFEAISFGKLIIAHPHSIEGVYDNTAIPVYIASIVEDIKWITTCFANKNIFSKNKLRCRSYITDYNFYVVQQYKTFIEF